MQAPWVYLVSLRDVGEDWEVLLDVQLGLDLQLERVPCRLYGVHLAPLKSTPGVRAREGLWELAWECSLGDGLRGPELLAKFHPNKGRPWQVELQGMRKNKSCHLNEELVAQGLASTYFPD